MRRSLLLLPLALLLTGCDSAGQYFPLEVNEAASYRVRGFHKETAVVKVRRVVSVAGARGFELQGPSGVSRLGWSNGVLFADELSNARFRPAIPLLAPNNLKDPLEWKGSLGFLENEENGATATLVQSAKAEIFNGRHLNVITATLTINTSKRSIELVSAYAPGLGLIRQQQRTNGQFDLELTRL